MTSAELADMDRHLKSIAQEGLRTSMANHDDDMPHLSDFRLKVLDTIESGKSPLDPTLSAADRRQVLWALDFLLEHRLIDVGLRLTVRGAAALAPKPVGESDRNKRRRGWYDDVMKKKGEGG